jgi:hypothetical protein
MPRWLELWKRPYLTDASQTRPWLEGARHPARTSKDVYIRVAQWTRLVLAVGEMGKDFDECSSLRK